MNSEIKPEAGETLLYQVNFAESMEDGSVLVVARIAVSDRALHWPAQKTFAISDPHYTRRIPKEEIAEVRIGRLSRAPAYVIAAVFAAIIVGACFHSEFSLGAAMVFYSLTTIIGLALMAILWNRPCLDVKTASEMLRLKTFGSFSFSDDAGLAEAVLRRQKKPAFDSLNSLLDACQLAGIKVVRDSKTP